MQTNIESLEVLVERLRSKDFGDVWDAIAKLQQMGWLYDGSLRDKNVSGGNFYETFMPDANLSGADFSDANLYSADLTNVQCAEARFLRAVLVGAVLIDADFHNAIFDEANLFRATILGNGEGSSFKNADLREAQLGGSFRSANFEGANLFGAKFNAIFDEDTILPNGERWQENTDINDFTNQLD
jgi:uncharacterized protein YjbI with pentapeptide repeats